MIWSSPSKNIIYFSTKSRPADKSFQNCIPRNLRWKNFNTAHNWSSQNFWANFFLPNFGEKLQNMAIIFQPKFRFLTNLETSPQNLDLWPKFSILLGFRYWVTFWILFGISCWLGTLASLGCSILGDFYKINFSQRDTLLGELKQFLYKTFSQ